MMDDDHPLASDDRDLNDNGDSGTKSRLRSYTNSSSCPDCTNAGLPCADVCDACREEMDGDNDAHDETEDKSRLGGIGAERLSQSFYCTAFSTRPPSA